MNITNTPANNISHQSSSVRSANEDVAHHSESSRSVSPEQSAVPFTSTTSGEVRFVTERFMPGGGYELSQQNAGEASSSGTHGEQAGHQVELPPTSFGLLRRLRPLMQVTDPFFAQQIIAGTSMRSGPTSQEFRAGSGAESGQPRAHIIDRNRAKAAITKGASLQEAAKKFNINLENSLDLADLQGRADEVAKDGGPLVSTFTMHRACENLKKNRVGETGVSVQDVAQKYGIRNHQQLGELQSVADTVTLKNKSYLEG